MPRERERNKRRAMGLCVECPRRSDSARCPACHLREKRRAGKLAAGTDIYSRANWSGSYRDVAATYGEGTKV